MLDSWYEAFDACADIEVRQNGQGVRAASVRILRYPDGKSWLEQAVLVTRIFQVMADEIRRTVQRG